MSAPAALPRVRLIGLPTDSHSSYLRGAAAAPAAIRAALGSDHANQAAENGIELGRDVLVEDVGDLPLAERDSDIGLIQDAITGAASVGADIVELNPARDPGSVTATLAAKLVKELASLTAKAGP